MSTCVPANFPEATETFYITIDLMLKSRRDLAPLVQALESRKVFLLGEVQEYRGLYMATLELVTFHQEGRTPTQEKDISKMLKAVRQFDARERKHWNACKSRIFSLGYESGLKPFAFSNLLSSNLIRAVADVNAGIEVVIYQRLASDPVAL